VTKGPGSKAQGLAMAFKLLESAQAHWRAVNGPHLVALVRAGAQFDKGCWSSTSMRPLGRCVTMLDALRRPGLAAVTVGSNSKQLAIRTDRLAALVMGGFPPIDRPYAQMLRVTTATHAMASSASTRSTATTSQPSKEPSGEPDWSRVEVSLTEAQTRQFVTLYQALQGFDDRAAQAQIRCPRLCFVGAADEIDYGERWGGVQVSLAGPVINRRAELEALGWQVQVLEGLDHTQAMQAVHVLPILRPWLVGRLGR
jgi:hypothetical protein